MKIGYQGIEGSNSRAAAENMAVRMQWRDVEYVPLVHSQGVVEAMQSGAVDYGVMATYNHRAGIVEETETALKGVSYEVIAEECLPIHHFMFVKDPAVQHPAAIASHPQALKQCQAHLAQLEPDAKWIELEDTAIGARYLAEGILDPSTAILCRRNAGAAFGLYLLHENCEDDPTNATDFVMISLKQE